MRLKNNYKYSLGPAGSELLGTTTGPGVPNTNYQKEYSTMKWKHEMETLLL